MTQAEQAQKGFKTFILTLSISLILFGVVYFLITNSNTTKTADIESTDPKTAQQIPTDPQTETVFGQLANQKVDAQPQYVLAASTVATTAEPTQATGTPSGGIVSVTFGLIASLIAFLYGTVMLARDPRRLALQSFEDRITRIH